MSNHISQDDLLLFALQFLAEDEMTAAHTHLLTCEDCRKQVAWTQGDLAGYALTAEAIAPPAESRERLMRAIAKEKRVRNNVTQMPVAAAAIATATAEPRSENVVSFDDAPVRRRMGVAGWAGWAVAATAIAAGGLQYQRSEQFRTDLAESRTELAQVSEQASKASLVMETLTDSHAKQVSLALPSTTAVPEAHASYLGKKGSLVFVANHLNALASAKTYELWIIPSGKGAVPIPAGTFKPDAKGHANLVMASLPKDVDVAAFGVTIEPEGGSEKPTMPIVLVGQ